MRWLALGAAVLYQVLWLTIISHRGNLNSTPWTSLLAEIVIPLTAAVLAFGVAVAPGPNGLGVPKVRLAWLTLLAPLVFVLGTMATAPEAQDPQPFVQHAFGCMGWTAVFSALPLLLAARAYRASFVAAPAWRFAALGISCAGLAAATMSLACTVDSAAHVIVGHGGMMLVAGLGGALLGRRITQA
jgi:Negative regulator of sigma F